MPRSMNSRRTSQQMTYSCRQYSGRLRREDVPGARSKQRYSMELYLLDGRNRLEARWRNFDPSEESEGHRAGDIRDLVRAAIDGHDSHAVLLYRDDNPWDLVVSANLQRRHLDASQRGLVGAKIATARQGERRDLAP